MFNIPQIRFFDQKTIVEKVEQIQEVSRYMDNLSENNCLNDNVQKENQKSNKKGKYSEKNISEIIEKFNRQLASKGVKMDLGIHESTNRLVIKLIDIESNDTIKEIFSEELLDSVVKNWGIIGNLIDKEG